MLFPVGFVAQRLLAGLPPLQTVVFLLSIAAFIAVFLVLMLRYPFPKADLYARELRVRVFLLTALAVMALYVEVAYASGPPWRFMYVIVAAGVVLPTRKALWAVAGATVFAGAFAVVRYGWSDAVMGWASLIPFPLIGTGMIAVGRLVVTVRELQAAREEIARLAVSEERLRFARDLHDLLGHSLSLITLKSELAGRLLPESPDRAAAEVHDVEEVARTALREVREAVVGYRKTTLAEELAGAREMLEAADVECRVDGPTTDLPPATDAVLAWTVREGVTNIIRHSRAGRCEIVISNHDGEAVAEITDEGANHLDGKIESGGSGLSGLSERVLALGGDFHAGTRDQGGFRLRVGIPFGVKPPESGK